MYASRSNVLINIFKHFILPLLPVASYKKLQCVKMETHHLIRDLYHIFKVREHGLF